MSRGRWAPSLAAALALALAAACGAPQAGETLAESVRTYNEGIRWQRYAVAASRVPAAARSAFVDEWDQRAEDLRVTDYEVVRLSQDGPRRARVHVKLSWYRESEGSLRDTHAVQIWEQQGKAWFLVEQRRLRGAAMPGLPEPATPDEPGPEEAPGAAPGAGEVPGAGAAGVPGAGAPRQAR